MKKYILTVSFLIACALNSMAKIKISQITCEYRKNPVGISELQPHLSWVIESDIQNSTQKSYQILASSSKEYLEQNMADLWDSKVVLDSQSVNIKYTGKKLSPRDKVYWKVRVTDHKDNTSEWSEIGFFSIGLLSEADWQAKWIGCEKKLANDEPLLSEPKMMARYFRKEFESKKNIKNATLYITGLGLYEPYINGEKITKSVLPPAQTEFKKTVFYNTYDVKAYLAKGKNAIGVILGNGRWLNIRNEPGFAKVDAEVNYPKLRAQLEVEFEDGSKQTIVSDNSWKLTNNGPVRENNEFDGETYNANLELGSWSSAQYSDKNWIAAEVVNAPLGKLKPQTNEPILVMDYVSPKKITEMSKNKVIVDIGQNMVGWLQIKLMANKGDSIKMRFAETLLPNGELSLENLRSAKVTDIYVAKGEGVETYEPRFTYHGFRYVEISGYKNTPQLADLLGKVVYDDVETIGNFESNNQVLNQIYKNAFWGIRGNYRSFPTDCPQRDERLGWLGDRGASSKGEAYIFKNITLYKKWLSDIKDAQREDGALPDVAPTFYQIYNEDVTWPSAYVIIPEFYFQIFGDTTVINDNYETIKNWMNHMEKYLANDLIAKDIYGDWCTPPENLKIIFTKDPNRKTTPILLASSYFYFDYKLLEKYALMLNKPNEAILFAQKAEKIKNAINKVLLNPINLQYENNTPTSSLLPLAFGITEPKNQGGVFKNLVDKLNSENNLHVASGLIGAQWQMKTLTNFGRPDIAFTMATQTDYPSWGYMISKDATTIWELWNGDQADPSMNSGNHVMLLGDLISWMYEDVAGMKTTNGFKNIEFKPILVNGLTSAKASHFSEFGLASISWKIENKSLKYQIKIPVNSKGKVFLPVSASSKVIVNGATFEYENFTVDSKNNAYINCGSGNYDIEVTNISMPNYPVYMPTPIISPKDTSVNAKEVLVCIKAKTTGSKIYYTTDGSIPTVKSRLYTNLFKINQTGVVIAKEFLNDTTSSNIVQANFDLYDKNINGAKYKYYEGKFNKMPNFDTLKVVREGVTSTFDPNTLSNSLGYYALHFETYLKIDADDEYTFYITSDDGSQLFINDKLLIDNDGTHGVETRSGAIVLKKGIHKINIKYFESTQGKFLGLEMANSKGLKTKVPLSKLFLNK